MSKYGGYPAGWDEFGRRLVDVLDRVDADLGQHRPRHTKRSHPYSYDPFTIWGEPYPNPTCSGSVYVDRLQQWDYAKYERLSKRFFANERVFCEFGCRGDLIERFLRAWEDNEAIKLLRVVEYCDPSTGYPTWRLDYRTEKS